MENKNSDGFPGALKTPNGVVDVSKNNSDDEKQTKSITNPPEKSEIQPFKVPEPLKSVKSLNENIVIDKVKKERETDVTSKLDSLSPTEKLKESQTPIPYKEPSWGGISKEKYSLEVLKNGVIIDTIELKKSYYFVGRLPSCDIPMEHPSLSRHHAVIQFCCMKTENHDIGWYLYDLDSTHGTWINKHKVYAKKYYKIHVGYVLKFGGSTRLYILQGPDEDREVESEMSVTELKEIREKHTKEAQLLRQADIAAEEMKLEALRKKEEDSGCSWGMDEDAIDDESANPFSEDIKLENEELYISDPKKALKGFYEREGFEEPEYIVTDAGSGKYKCAVELPVDGPNGEPVIAEAIVSGKKKEAVLQCALEGCRILDRMNLLRSATHESRKRKQKNWEDDDFYDSDEDLFLDRTGDIEKKRKQRMKKAGKIEEKTETYQSLLTKHEEIIKEIQEIETKLEKAKSDAAAMENDDLDALDAYMMGIKSGVMDTKTKMSLKRQLMELRQEEMKIRKLVNIAKPASLPELKSPHIAPKPVIPIGKNKLPVVGKIRQHKTQKRPLLPLRPVKEVDIGEDVIVEEEDEDDDDPSEKLYREDPSSRLNEIPSDSTSGVPETSDKLVQRKETLSIGEVLSRLQKKVESIPKAKLKSNSDTANTGESQSHQSSHKQQKKHEITNEGKIIGDYDATDPDYAVWVPPAGQSGDGKTSLNEKFGY